MDIKKYFSAFIILLLVAIILLQRSCTSGSIVNTPPTVKIDTIWKIKHDTFTKYIKIISITHPKPPIGPAFQPGTTIDTCTTRFNKLLKDFITTRVYNDTLKIDSIGTVIITDTVFMNKLGKRTYIQDTKIPIITKTITKQADPKRQLYFGGNLFGDKTKLQLLTPGILYKTKKDHIYQINIGINFDGTITYGAGMYWKIKLK